MGNFRARTSRDEDGVALILALIFVVVIGAVSAALLSLSGGSLLNTYNLRTQRSLEYAADGAVTAAVQAVRFTFDASTSPSFGDCLPNGAADVIINNVTIYVECEGTYYPDSPPTRVFTFYACTTSSCTSAGNSVLTAQVTFDDFSAQGADNCSVSLTSTCGTGMTVNTWSLEPNFR